MGTEVTSLLIEVNTNHVDNLIEHGSDFSSLGVGPFGDIYRSKTGIDMYFIDNRYSPHKCNVWKEQVSCLILVISLFSWLSLSRVGTASARRCACVIFMSNINITS